jgi:hypothetical protein
VNHVHILDEFAHRADVTERYQVQGSVDASGQPLEEWDIRYMETHPDFIAACELGRVAAQLWALKLRADFPGERFRVYYTEYDNPIIRFHKVRPSEGLWLSDEQLNSPTRADLRNALVFDTESLGNPFAGLRLTVQ